MARGQRKTVEEKIAEKEKLIQALKTCLLYTSDAADEL